MAPKDPKVTITITPAPFDLVFLGVVRLQVGSPRWTFLMAGETWDTFPTIPAVNRSSYAIRANRN